MTSYPTTLPCFNLSGYGYNHFNTHQRTEFNSGFVRQRRKQNGTVTFSVSVTLSKDELSTFEAWREYELKDIGWFTGQVLTGQGLDDWILRFTGKGEQVNAISTELWSLSLSVEARKPKFISESEYYLQNYDVPVDFGTQTQAVMDTYYT